MKVAWLLIANLVASFSLSVNAGNLPENLFAKPAETSEEIAFICGLKYAVRRNDKNWIAERVLYPISEQVNGQQKAIRNSAQFEKYYSQIMTADIKTAVLSQDVGKLFKNSRGVMIGHGEIWIMTGYYVMGKKTPDVLIIAINNS